MSLATRLKRAWDVFTEEEREIEPEILKTRATMVDEVLRSPLFTEAKELEPARFIPRIKKDPIKEITEQQNDD